MGNAEMENPMARLGMRSLEASSITQNSFLEIRRSSSLLHFKASTLPSFTVKELKVSAH